MRAIVAGAVLGLLVVVVGVPLAPAAAALAILVQPVTVAFAAGILARPSLAHRRWSR
ncbi:hypothetical protein [Streptomyces bobili]|uniref:hypothetical protein n=1 Tax=Streptomyces bobili TaxID=67280 RepID=UPI003716DA6A